MESTVKELPIETHFSLESLIGRLLDDRYQVDELIGQGAMGAVFRARQIRLRRDVAIKVPKPEHCNNREFLARFEREALTMAKVVHENVVQVFDVYVSNDPQTPSFIAMEIVEGAELEKFLRMQEASLTVSAVVDLFAQIARGLDSAHQHGVVHRDIKPSNIIVTMPQRVAKIMDFGIARIEMENVFATQDASAIGTPAFMAPEQVRGEAVTPAADIYALAMTIYRLLARKIAFDATTATDLLFKQVNDQPIPLHERNPRIPENVHGVLLHAMDKDPEKRPLSAMELVDAVGDALKPLENMAFAELFPGPNSGSTATQISPATTRIKAEPDGLLTIIVRRKKLIGFSAAIGIVVLILAFVVAVFAKQHSDNKRLTKVISDNAAKPMAVATQPQSSPQSQPEATPVAVADQSVVSFPDPIPTPIAAPPQEPEVAIAPTAAVPAAPTPAVTPAAQSANSSVSELRSSDFNRAVNTPLPDADTKGVRLLVQEHFSEQIEKPFYRGQFDSVNNTLVDLAEKTGRGNGAETDGDTARDLIRIFNQLRPQYNDLALTLQIRKESQFWENRALLSLNVVIAGRPRGNNDPSFRKVVFESSKPFTATVRLENRKARLTSFSGDLGNLK